MTMTSRPFDIPPRVVERVQTRVVTDFETGCLISTYSVGSHGYAQVGWEEQGERTVTLCHRVAWIAEHGPIPDDLTVDHTCKQRRCVNVAHLRLLTNHENARRTHGRDWPLGECVNGHPNTELITTSAGSLECGVCRVSTCPDCGCEIKARSARCRSCAKRAMWEERRAS